MRTRIENQSFSSIIKLNQDFFFSFRYNNQELLVSRKDSPIDFNEIQQPTPKYYSSLNPRKEIPLKEMCTLLPKFPRIFFFGVCAWKALDSQEKWIYLFTFVYIPSGIIPWFLIKGNPLSPEKKERKKIHNPSTINPLCN